MLTFFTVTGISIKDKLLKNFVKMMWTLAIYRLLNILNNISLPYF